MAKLYAMTEADRAEFKQLVDLRRQNKLPRGPGDADGLDVQGAPETYIALVPGGGITARVGDEPGSEECDLYRIVQEAEIYSLIPLNIQKRVYNLSTSEISGDQYIAVTRAKSGHWLVASGGGGGTSGYNGSLEVCVPTGGTKTLTIEDGLITAVV